MGLGNLQWRRVLWEEKGKTNVMIDNNGVYVDVYRELHDFGVQLGKQKRLREYNYRLAELEAEERRLGLAKRKEDGSGGGG